MAIASNGPLYGGSLQFSDAHIALTPATSAEALEHQAADYAKRAKTARKAEKQRKADAKEKAAQRSLAIDALKRVAADPSKGYASVEAARTLLEVN